MPVLLISDDRPDIPTGSYLPVIMVNMLSDRFSCHLAGSNKKKLTNICWIGRRQFFDYLSNLPGWMVVILLVGVFEDVIK